ncbi:MAG: sensor histidine kinase [Bacillota bacterium]
MKFKPGSTLFRKLLITYGVTIIVSFILLAVLLMNFLDRYFVESKKQLLFEQGKTIANDIVLAYYTGVRDRQSLNNNLMILDTYLNARIWLVDEEGTVLLVSGENEDGGLGKSIDADKLRSLYRGYQILERGRFGSMLKEYSLTVGYPIFIGESFKGGVLIHASLAELQRTLRDVYKITIGTILISMLFAYTGLFFQIKRISKPLKEISEASRKIASGEFQKRLRIDTDDEIEELGRSFNHMAESLEKIEENRANLVANISHDLRTPMTSIIGFIEGILDGTIPEENHKKYLNIILEESKRLVKITNDILELSNMQQGAVSFSKAVFELNEAIRRRLISFEKRIMEKKLDVELVLDNDKNYVYSDSIYIDRVLQNLLDNAVKFSPEGGKISIRSYSDNSKVKVEIMNNGADINEAELKKIWERFHKGDPSRGRHKSGFGLGLAIVKEIIHQLDEEIRVESNDGFVKFTFTITAKK